MTQWFSILLSCIWSLLATESSQDTMVWPGATRNISQWCSQPHKHESTTTLNSILSFHLPSKQDKINSLVVCDTYLSGFHKDHLYRMVKESNSNIWANQTIVSDQSELTILLCQPMNSLLLMKTTLPWYSGLQLLPSYIYDPWDFKRIFWKTRSLRIKLLKTKPFYIHQ